MFTTLSVVFGLLYILTKRKEWLALCVLNVLLLINCELYGKNDDMLYYNRSIASFLVGCFMVWRGGILGFYQAIIQLLILCTYAALAYDVSHGEHILIYNHYETVIYGLVTCQFIGIFKDLQRINLVGCSSYFANRSYNRGVTKS